jgi:hypothetical protein
MRLMVLQIMEQEESIGSASLKGVSTDLMRGLANYVERMRELGIDSFP